MVQTVTRSIKPTEPLIISIKEARKLMGRDAVSLTDDQIEDLIITLTEASSMLLNQRMVPKKRRVK